MFIDSNDDKEYLPIPDPIRFIDHYIYLLQNQVNT